MDFPLRLIIRQLNDRLAEQKNSCNGLSPLHCHCEPVRRLAWQSPGIISHFLQHERSSNAPKIGITPTIVRFTTSFCVPGDCHVGAMPLLAMTCFFGTFPYYAKRSFTFTQQIPFLLLFTANLQQPQGIVIAFRLALGTKNANDNISSILPKCRQQTIPSLFGGARLHAHSIGGVVRSRDSKAGWYCTR